MFTSQKSDSTLTPSSSLGDVHSSRRDDPYLGEIVLYLNQNLNPISEIRIQREKITLIQVEDNIENNSRARKKLTELWRKDSAPPNSWDDTGNNEPSSTGWLQVIATFIKPMHEHTETHVKGTKTENGNTHTNMKRDFFTWFT